MVKVKICGITSERDGAYALEAGADAIGLVFARGPREVSVRKAARIAARVGAWAGVGGGGGRNRQGFGPPHRLTRCAGSGIVDPGQFRDPATI